MSTRNTEDIIGALYDMIQDARSVPLNADKCMVERDKVLDMLDEIITQLPSELKQSRTIVESRNELISQARHEAEAIIRQAQEEAKELAAYDVDLSDFLPEQIIPDFIERVSTIKQGGNRK